MNKKQDKKKSKIFTIFKWIILGLFFSVFFVITTLLLINNVKFLRKPTLNFIVSIVNSSLTGKIEIGDLHFQSLNHIEINDFKLLAANDTLAQFKKLDLKFFLLELLNNNIKIKYLKLYNTRVKLLRSKTDSLWNFDKIAPPSESNSPPGKSPLIFVQNLQLFDTYIVLKDSTFIIPELPFNPLDLKFNNLNLEIAAELDFNSSKIHSIIKNFKFDEENTGFSVKSLNFEATLDSTLMNVDKMTMELENSSLNLTAHFTKYSPLSLQQNNDILKSKIDISFDATNFSTTEIKRFAFVPLNSSQTANIKFRAKGSFQDLDIDTMNIQLASNEIQSFGKLHDIGGNNFQYLINIFDSKITDSAIKDLISIDLSAIPQFQQANVKNIQINGNLENVNVDFNFSSKIGNAKGKAFLDFAKELKYGINADFSNINLEEIARNKTLASNLNGRIDYEGSGDKIQNLQGKGLLQLDSSLFNKIQIKKSILDLNLSNSIVNINNCEIHFPNNKDQILGTTTASINLTGLLNMQDMKVPKYDLNMNIQDVNFANIFNNETFPQLLNSQINVSGASFNLDSMNLNVEANFKSIEYPNFALLPIIFNFKMQNKDSLQKSIQLTFGTDTIEINGKLNLNELAQQKANDLINYASLFIANRYEQLILKESDSTKEKEISLLAKNLKFPNSDAVIELKINDLGFLNIFTKDLFLSTSINTKMNFISTDTTLFLDFTNLKIGNTNFQNKDASLQLTPFYLSGLVNIIKADSTIKLDYATLTIDELKSINFNQLQIQNPILDLFLADSNFVVGVSLEKDTTFKSALDLKGQIKRDNIEINFNNISLSLFNNIKLKNSTTAFLKLDNSSIVIKNFNLFGLNNEKISISGYGDTASFQDFKLEASNFKLSNYSKLFPQNIQDYLLNFDVQLTTAELTANGQYKSPSYTFTTQIDSIYSFKKYSGKATAQVDYFDKNIIGHINLSNDKQDFNTLEINIKKIPIDLSLSDNLMKIYDKYDIDAKLNSFNLQTIAPFIPVVHKLRGYINTKINISGTNFEDYLLNGEIETKDVSFNLVNNNLDYSLFSKINISQNSININNLKINNFGTNSYAQVTGSIDFKSSNVENLNLNLIAKDFFVLDEASKKPSPMFFGKLSISTKNEGVNISGPLEKLNILGNIQINPSNLTIKNVLDEQIVTKTNFEYEIKNNTRIAKITTVIDSSQQKQISNSKPKVTLSYIPDVDLNIFIPKDIGVKIDLGAIGEIVAVLGASDPTVPLKYVMNEQNILGQLYGELQIKDGSTLNSYRSMKASGTISFQTGKIDNPAINITAFYNGTIGEAPNQIKYVVNVYITGTAQTPKVRFDYTLNGIAPQAEQKKIEENALYLLLFGQLPGSEGIIDPNVVNKLGNSGISSLASRTFSDLLLKTGVIESADVQLNTEDYEKTKIQLKGKIFGSLNWSFGGSVADLTRSNQIVVEVPLSIDSETFNQIVWMIAYSTNGNSSIIDPDEKIWELKLKIGGSW